MCLGLYGCWFVCVFVVFVWVCSPVGLYDHSFLFVLFCMCVGFFGCRFVKVSVSMFVCLYMGRF